MILAIDTSTLTAAVALVDAQGALLATRSARVTTHSELLLDLVAAVLDEAGARPADLSAIACGAGPGSFTGLRIGLATAKGLCLATGAPLLLVSSLRTIARRAAEGASAVSIIDAFKGEVYAGFYRGGDDPAALRDEQVLGPARLRAILDELAAAGPLVVLGDGLRAWPALAAAIEPDIGGPDAADLGRLAALRLARGERDDLAAAVPTYIRASEAELAAAARAAAAAVDPA